MQDVFWTFYVCSICVLCLVSKVIFPSLLFLRIYTFWEELFCLFYKSLLSSLTFVRWKFFYLVERFLHKLCPCLNIAIVLSQLGIIARIFSYLIYNIISLGWKTEKKELLSWREVKKQLEILQIGICSSLDIG